MKRIEEAYQDREGVDGRAVVHGMRPPVTPTSAPIVAASGRRALDTPAARLRRAACPRLALLQMRQVKTRRVDLGAINI